MWLIHATAKQSLLQAWDAKQPWMLKNGLKKTDWKVSINHILAEK
jgi:hypothetical protein